jgi:hypothetical protein
MVRKLLIPVVYLVIAAFTFVFFRTHETTYLSSIARPIAGGYDTYRYLSYFWIIFTLSLWIPRIGLYCFAPVNIIIISNAYFAILLRVYFWSFDFGEIEIYIQIILTINILMILGRVKIRDICSINGVVILCVLPLVFQYALVAIVHE